MAYEVDLPRLRTPGAVLLVGGLVLAHLPTGVGLPCPLRTLTGVPCPFCGMTTSVRQTLGGHLRSAIGAAPLGVVAVAAAVIAVLGVGPRTFRVACPLLIGVIGLEWVFELVRFHIL